MNRTLKKILTCFLALLGVYLLLCFCVSAKVYGIARSSYEHFGQDNPFPSLVSDEIYERMSYRRHHMDTLAQDGMREHGFLRFPLTMIWGGEAKTVYKYSYEVRDNSREVMSGSWKIPVYITLKLESGGWVITDYFEAP